MKNDKKLAPKENKKGAGSYPENKFKKGKGGVIGNIVTTAMEKAKSKTGKGLANEGTIVSYDEER